MKKTLLSFVMLGIAVLTASADIPLRVENNTTNWLYVSYDSSDRDARYYVVPGHALEISWPSTDIYFFSGYGSAQRTLQDMPQILYVGVEASEADDGFYGLHIQAATHDSPATVFFRGAGAAGLVGGTAFLIRKTRVGIEKAM
jgi:hypothetical protein